MTLVENLSVKFVDSRVLVYFWLIIITFEFALYLYNMNRNSRYKNNKSAFGDHIFLLNDKVKFFSFNRIIKSNLLFDKEFFKNSERTHLLLVQAVGISMNACFVIVLIYWIISKFIFTNISLTKVDDETLIKSILFFVSSILAVYWNLKNDQNKKFDYCLSTYNEILKDLKGNYDKNNIDMREACLALDIFTMDLWSKRILSSFFKRILLNAVKGMESDEVRLLNGEMLQNEAYKKLLEHAKKTRLSSDK